MQQSPGQPQDHAPPEGGRSEQSSLKDLPGRVRPYFGVARLALLVERIAPLGLSLYAILGVFVLVAWLGVFRLLPAWLHLLILVGTAASLLAALWYHLRSFRWPSAAETIRRVERDSGLAHRPLTHLTDRAVALGDDPALTQLWAQYRARLMRSIGTLRFSAPRADLAERDPFALRALLLLLGLTTFVVAGDLGWQRIVQALSPNFAGYIAADTVTVDAWITPPDYTGLPPISLNAGGRSDGHQILVPTGSKLLVQAQGIGSAAKLLANDKSTTFNMLDPLTQRIETVLKSGDSIAIEASGRQLANWPVKIAPDLPPSAAFAADPSATDRGALRVDYQAADDYGVKDLRLYIQRGNQSIEAPLAISAADNKAPKGSTYLDFTAHPWAGLPVELRLVARDALGQVGASAPVSMTMPERHFYHPIARALIEQRKRLAAAELTDQNALAAITQSLVTINEQPDAYDDSVSAFLGINLAWRQLMVDRLSEQARTDVEQLLWDTALDIEDGGVSLALRELRRLQRELQDALARHASPEEIEALMNKLQQAMNNYVRNLQQQLQRAIAKGMQPGRVNPNSLQLSQSQLNDMLNDARRMAESGSTQSAQQMLDRLQQMLEGLQAGVSPRMGQGQGDQSQQMMNDLAHIMRDQQKLLQDSFRMQRQQSGANGQGDGEQSDSNGVDPGQNAGAQEGLRRQLGKLMQDIGNAAGNLPQGLGQAEQAMRRATQALQQGDLAGASEAQNNVLDNLQKGLQDLSKMLGDKVGQGNGPGQRPPMNPFGQGNDDSGQGSENTIGRLPRNAEERIQRSQQIFEELRQRRNNPDRPKLEKDYLDRLLRQF
ncbi:MAG TPA: TIGR02302 family protein [Dongiaceae bacterium]|nr:TIGR02302 family protein [Dongiaceae bacterium]